MLYPKPVATLGHIRGRGPPLAVGGVAKRRFRIQYPPPEENRPIGISGFLRMVRAIVGTLIEVGRGKHDPAWVKELIETGTRGDAGESVPGHALFLSKVQY